ncbi:MAG TPA: hypothetical protein VNU68_16035, partial [Verrucomicrobiae bacterium]|nr:hypothetical protein [Verrucomicrobiae bacterium]
VGPFVAGTVVPPDLSNVVALAAGEYHSMALRSDGTVRAWGQDINGDLTNTSGLNAIAAIATSGYHSLALRSNGTVVAWGRNWTGETDVPEGLSNVVAIAAGLRHSMALRGDGTVVAWGQAGATNTPPGLTNVLAIAGGDQYCVALLENPSLHRRLLALRPGSSTINATVSAFSGRLFTLESTESIAPTHWTPVTTLLGRGTIATLTDTNIVGAQKFYRLRRE